MFREHVGSRRLIELCRGMVLALLLFASHPPTPAGAHAALVRSDPPSGAVLAVAPAAVVLTFSEALDAPATSVRLLDGAGHEVAAGPGIIPVGDRLTLRLELPLLGDGVYSAVWQARSAVDGHDTLGTVSFSVGAGGDPGAALLAQLPPPGAVDPATALPSPFSTALRWLNYLAAALAAGSVAFVALVWRPALRFAPAMESDGDRFVSRAVKSLALAGIVAVAAFTLLDAASRAFAPAGAPTASWLDALAAAAGGQTGLLLGARLIVAALFAVLVYRAPSAGAGPAARWWALIALGGAVLLTFSLRSHSAAERGAMGAALDWLHLMAVSVWIGALPALALGLTAARRGHGGPPAALLAGSFSRVAVSAVGVLVITGVLNALPLVQTFEAFTGTTQGRALAVKLALFVMLLALGAVNLLRLSPRLRQAGGGAAARRQLLRTVKVELAIAALVLLATAVLTGVAPAHQALEAHDHMAPMQNATEDGVQMTLFVVPGGLGPNAIAVDLVDGRTGAEAARAAVVLRLTMPEDPSMGTGEFVAQTSDGLRYTATGSYLSMNGTWQIEVIVRRAGFDDARHKFQMQVENTGVVKPAMYAARVGQRGR